MQEWLLAWIVDLAARRGKALLIGFALATAVGGGLGTGIRISTSQKALVPQNHPVQVEFREFVAEFGAVDNLVVVLEGDPATIRSSADYFAAELRRERRWVQQVFYKVDLGFFLERALLYAPVEALARGEEVLRKQQTLIARVAEVRNLAAILTAIDQGFGEQAVEFHPEAVNNILRGIEELFAEWRRWLDDPTTHQTDLVTRIFAGVEQAESAARSGGYLVSRDGRMLFLLVQPTSSSDEAGFLRPFTAAMREAVDRVFTAYPSLQGKVTVAFTGLPAHVLTEIETVFSDVLSGATISVLLVILIVLLGFRTWRKVIIAVVPLVCGMVISLGLVTVVLGRLNLMSAAFMAVMFGMSIDFGIYLVRRTEEELGRGEPILAAVRTAMVRTGKGVLTGGLTTACAFFGIALSDFTGFAELGLTAGIGTVVCLATVMLLVPTLLLRLGAEPKRPGVAAVRGLAKSRLAHQASLVVAGTVALAAILAVQLGRDNTFDYDALHLLPRDTESTRYQLRMEEESDYSISAAMVIEDSLEGIRKVSERLKTLPEVRRVESLADIIPADQAEKLSIIRRGRSALLALEIEYVSEDRSMDDYLAQVDRLSARFADAEEAAFSAGRVDLVEQLGKVRERIEQTRQSLSQASPEVALERTRAFERSTFASAKQVVDLARRWTEARPITEAQLPPEVVSRLKSPKGHYLAYVSPKGSVWDVDFLDRFVAQLREVTPRITGFPVTHQVYSRMVVRGFLQAMAYSLLAVILLLALDFRASHAVILALLPLVLSMLFLQLVVRFAGLQYNYANIAAFPVLMGYGVAYGVNIVSRWLEQPGETAWVAALTIGKGVVLSAATTLAAIGSIVAARHNGVSTFGVLLLAGVILCLVNAVLVLPAIIDLIYIQGGPDHGREG